MYNTAAYNAYIHTEGWVVEVKERNTAARQGLGRTGERLAAERLQRSGYIILERNFRCRYGEIDLVAEHDSDLVFIEVKTRRGRSHGLPEEAVNQRKQQKIIQVGQYYLFITDADPARSWRVDVVAVQLSVSGQLEEIRVYQHAFSE